MEEDHSRTVSNMSRMPTELGLIDEEEQEDDELEV